MKKIVKKNIGIVGATGYVGEELLSFLDTHEGVQVTYVSSFNSEGKLLFDVVKKYSNISNLKLENINNITNFDLDIVFFATKHDFSMSYVSDLLKRDIKVIDLSADFRFSDKSIWEKAYGTAHKSPDLLKSSIYGLPELNSSKISKASLVGVPGCYPTASLLGLMPIAKYIKPNSKIVLDVKSGVSGAGRNSVEGSLKKDMENNFKAYSPEFHRHQPEIKSFLEENFNLNSNLIFVPHLLPIFRGEYITAYVDIEGFKGDLSDLYTNYYEGKTFVRVLKKGTVPELKKVQNTNFCDISPFFNENTAVIHVAIDNLIKGAAGQAIQCLNLMIGEKEEYTLK